MPDGRICKVAPVDVPCSGALRVAHPRADYSALATELLVELFQTLLAPADLAARAAMLRRPEEVNTQAFADAKGAFELFGTDARFMQSPVALGVQADASVLVFEAPGAKTVEDNTDFFVSRSDIASVCPHCAPVSLFLSNAHARQGGQGYRTTARGGSALAVLVRGATLWETVVLNLLPAPDFAARFAVPGAPANVYPWTSGVDTFTAGAVSPEQVGAFGTLWWCPVALHLVEDQNEDQMPCSQCGEAHPTHVRRVFKAATKSRGIEGVMHPRTAWSPHNKTGRLLPLQVPSNGLQLEDWLALSLGKSERHYPVAAVAALRPSEARRVELWSFGGLLSINTLVRWCDETTPALVAENPREAEVLRIQAHRLLEQALAKRDALTKALTTNLADNAKRKAPMPLSQSIESLVSRFETKARQGLLQALSQVDFFVDSLPADTAAVFNTSLSGVAFALFESSTIVNPLDVEQTRRVLSVRGALLKKLYPKPLNSPKASKAAVIEEACT